MNPNPIPQSGRVASLHVHPAKPGAQLVSVESIHFEAAKGIVEDKRYFNRGSRRQVTLIEREQLTRHEAVFGSGILSPGIVRSNIETTDIDLIALMGRKVRVGSAVLEFYEPRVPCAKMDAIQPGLRRAMENDRQGVLAIVVESGEVRVGDSVAPMDAM